MLNKERVRIKELLASPRVGETVTVWGWVRTARQSPAAGFVHINDGSTMGTLQLVIPPNRPDLPDARNISTGTCVKGVGTVVESQGKGQSHEVQLDELEIVGPVDEKYPLQKKRHGFEFLRTIPHLRARTNTFLSVFRMRHQLSYAIHEYFHNKGFAYVHPPLITRSDCEGAGEAFRVTTLDLDALRRGEKQPDSADFYGQQAYLTVSAQLEGETLALGMGEIYTFGPTFRADPSETSRHASEFWMIEPEMAFYDFDDLIDLITDFTKETTRVIEERCADEKAFFGKFIEKTLDRRYRMILDRPYARIDYTDAVEMLGKMSGKFEKTPVWGEDLATEHERFLTDHYFKSLVFVTNYPKSFKPFYMRLNDDDKTVAALDLLAPGVGELVGGSQREERIDVLERRADETQMDREEYEWFLQTRRWGTAPHSGFGIGFERFLMYLSGMKNIRDVLPYPRTRGSV